MHWAAGRGTPGVRNPAVHPGSLAAARAPAESMHQAARSDAAGRRSRLAGPAAADKRPAAAQAGKRGPAAGSAGKRPRPGGTQPAWGAERKRLHEDSIVAKTKDQLHLSRPRGVPEQIKVCMQRTLACQAVPPPTPGAAPDGSGGALGAAVAGGPPAAAIFEARPILQRFTGVLLRRVSAKQVSQRAMPRRCISNSCQCSPKGPRSCALHTHCVMTLADTAIIP